MKEDTERNVSLYECASLFAETMNGKFPQGCPEGSAIFFAVTDGDKVTSIINGDDDLIRNLIAYLAMNDEELRNIIGDGLVAAINVCKEEDS